MTHHNSNKKQKTSRHNADSSHREYKSFDHSLIGDSLNLGRKNVAQIAFALSNGTQEVKDLLLNECNIIYECRLCKNMFRSFANLVAHKRIYCQGHQCEQMALYDSSWFVPEQEKNDVKVEVTPEEPARNPTISFPPQLDSKTLELKRKSLHSIANSLQKDTHSDDDSDTKPISASQFYLNEEQREFKNTEKTRKDTTQLLTPQSLNKQTDSAKQTSIEESTLKTETSNQNSSENSSGETILLAKSSTEDIINLLILNESSPNDRYKMEILDESQLSANSLSPSKAKTMTPTPIVCKKKHNRPNRQSILKRESPNANVQKSAQISEMKPQDLKTVKPVWSGNSNNSNAYGLFLNRHYHSNILPPSIPSKKSYSSSAATSTSSSSSSILTNSNVHECAEQVCTKMQNKSKRISTENNQCNDHHERPINKTCIPIEVITIDSDNDDAYWDDIYAL